MNKLEITAQILKYMNILSKRRIIFNDPNPKETAERQFNDLERILDTLPIMVNLNASYLKKTNHPLTDLSEAELQIILDQMRYLANLAAFIDVMLPICNKYNPSEDDKQKILDYILNNKDDPQK